MIRAERVAGHSTPQRIGRRSRNYGKVGPIGPGHPIPMLRTSVIVSLLALSSFAFAQSVTWELANEYPASSLAGEGDVISLRWWKNAPRAGCMSWHVSTACLAINRAISCVRWPRTRSPWPIVLPAPWGTPTRYFCCRRCRFSRLKLRMRAGCSTLPGRLTNGRWQNRGKSCCSPHPGHRRGYGPSRQ